MGDMADYTLDLDDMDDFHCDMCDNLGCPDCDVGDDSIEEEVDDEDNLS